MTLTASPGTSAGEDLSLMGHTDVMPVTKQQSNLVEATTENTRDFAAVLGKVFKVGRPLPLGMSCFIGS